MRKLFERFSRPNVLNGFTALSEAPAAIAANDEADIAAGDSLSVAGLTDAVMLDPKPIAPKARAKRKPSKAPVGLLDQGERAKAFRAVIDAILKDNRNIRDIASDAGFNLTRTYRIFRNGLLPSDFNLLALCKYYGIDPGFQSQRWVNPDNYATIPVNERTILGTKVKWLASAPCAADPAIDAPAVQAAATGPITDRATAYRLMMQMRRADTRPTKTICRLAGLAGGEHAKYISHGALPTDYALQKLCDFYGIPLSIKPTRRFDPSHYATITAEDRICPTPLSKKEVLALARANTRQAAASSKPVSTRAKVEPVCSASATSPIEPASGEASKTSNNFDLETIERSLVHLERLVAQARGAASIEEQLADARRQIGALQVEISASKIALTDAQARLLNAENRALAAEERAQKAEEQLGQIRALAASIAA